MMVCLFSLSGMVTSCNEKTDSSLTDSYIPSSTAAVTAFSIKAKASANIDSTFFSIDLNRRVIFNADSLPVGADVTKLVPSITYTSSASAVTLTVTSGGEVTEHDYLTSPSDSIDFTNPVILSITAEDQTTVRDYTIKVNIHTTEPDSLVWDQLAVTPLPSRTSAPAAQKTVKYLDTTYSLIRESDNSYSLAVARDVLTGDWETKTLTLDFQPDLNTLRALPANLCILDEAGMLHVSQDGLNWTNTGLVWTNIIGAYGDVLLGMRDDNGVLKHTSWPATYSETPVKADFPVEGYSDFVQFSNRWTTLPIGFMTGGRLADGSITEKTWGFDGDNWEMLSEKMVPKLVGASIVPYYAYRKTSSSYVQTEFSVWMLIGGQLESGSNNRVIYVSYDNGVNWYAADTQMQLPDYFPALYNLNAIMVEWPKQASLEGNWSTRSNPAGMPMAKISYKVDNYEVYWDCPYIYIFGGITDAGSLNNEIWRGVLNRLSFIPQF